MKRAIIFASNVFSNGDASYECFAKEFNLSNEDLIRINKKYFIPAKKGRYNGDQLISKLAKELKTTKKHVLDNAKDCGSLFETNKEVMKLFKNLRNKHKVIAVSDTNELFATFPLEKKAYAVFDLAILSYNIKSIRPELKAYKEILKILKRLNFKAEDCIYIDSKEKMLISAKKLGIKTILFKDIKQLNKELKEI